MKLSRLVCFVALTLLVLPACVQPPTSAVSSKLSGSADEEYRILVAKDRERNITGAPQDPAARTARMLGSQARFVFMHDRGLAFIEKYPTDPRRWDVLVLLPFGRDHEVRPQVGGESQLVPVKESRDRWEQHYFPQLEQLLTAKDASTDARSQALRQLINYHTGLVQKQPPENDALTSSKVRTWLQMFRREFPRSGALGPLYHSVAVMLTLVDPRQCHDFLAEISLHHASDDPADRIIRQTIAGRRRILDGLTKPVDSLWSQLREFDSTFTDPTRYRGKVVLLVMGPVGWDYTARLEKLYAEHHASGFEIIQVAYYNASASAPPEQREKSAMERFVAARGWPWRVFWDPNPSSGAFRTAWGQNSIPAYLLLGRDGRITNYRNGSFNYAAQIPFALAESSPP